MNTGNQIRYIEHRNIDKAKWDACITAAPNGIIYAYSFYLDLIAKNWDALVLGDYEMIMPLPWKRKFGLSYIYIPMFASPLGIFGKNISSLLMAEMLTRIPKQFRLCDLNLNVDFTPVDNSYIIKKRVNHVFSLHKNYDSLFSAFRSSYKQIINKGTAAGCRIKKNIPVKTVLELAKNNLLHKTSITEDDFSRLEKVFHAVQEKLKTATYAVYSDKNELLASSIFFFSHNRAFYILAGTTQQGRTAGASHQMLNAFIKDHAGQNLVLDFEGSDITEIAFFFEGFGAMKETYTFIRINRLPFPLKIFKQ